MGCVTAKTFRSADRVMDYTPLSPINNLVDLFQKCFVLPCVDKDTIDHNKYLTHINDKSFVRCILLVVFPVIGSIGFAIYDAQKAKDPHEEVLNVQMFSRYPWGDDEAPTPLPEGWAKHVVEGSPLKYYAGETMDDIGELPVGTTYYTVTGTLVLLRPVDE